MVNSKEEAVRAVESAAFLGFRYLHIAVAPANKAKVSTLFTDAGYKVHQQGDEGIMVRW